MNGHRQYLENYGVSAKYVIDTMFGQVFCLPQIIYVTRLERLGWIRDNQEPTIHRAVQNETISMFIGGIPILASIARPFPGVAQFVCDTKSKSDPCNVSNKFARFIWSEYNLTVNTEYNSNAVNYCWKWNMGRVTGKSKGRGSEQKQRFLSLSLCLEKEKKKIVIVLLTNA